MMTVPELTWMLIANEEQAGVMNFGANGDAGVNGHWELPIGGHEDCRLVANKNCPVADTNLPRLGLSATGRTSVVRSRL
jgi:hypothetical protein